MKRILFCAALLAAAVIASATDVWEGEHAVDWSNTLNIEAAKFSDMKLGDKLVIEFMNAAGEVIELHSNGAMLPGTRFAHSIFPDQSSVEVFATPAMLASLQTHGLEVCGKDFIATKIWYGDGKESIDENTVWSGFFWMDNWGTLEITKNSFTDVDWSKFTAIRFYSEAGRTDYIINVMTTWDNKLGDQTTMTMTNEYAELSLSGIDMAAALEGTDRLMVQCNKEGGAPFNFTQIELVPDPMAVESISASGQSADASKKFDLQGRPVAQPVKGTVYILNGKKYLEK